MPAGLDLSAGYTIRLTAIDPTTGNVVTGIPVSDLVMLVNASEGTDVGSLAVGDFLLVPGLGA